MNKHHARALLLAALFFAQASEIRLFARSIADSIPYRLTEPTQVINLVYEELQEISGLGPADTPGVFCAISDERGEVLFIDGNGGGAILRRVLFREKGDFEGVEMARNCLYAVKSNGEIFEIARWKKAKPKVSSYKTFLTKTHDVEGLCYDKERNALLLACKGNPDSAYARHLYAFDLRANQLRETPVYTIDPNEVNALVPPDDDKGNYFSPSGVAIHPITGDVYVISTALKRILVLDYHTGKIRFAARLQKKITPQPEGISFDAAGNLYLASEGKKGEGLLLRFDYVRP